LHENSSHLGEGELAKLLEEARQSSGPIPDIAQLHPHFAVCADCRQQFEVVLAFDRQLTSSKHNEWAQRQTDCPKPEVWREIAAGLAPSDRTLICVSHASRCNYCGSLLRDAIAELSALEAEITDAERKQIAALDSAQLQWQERLGQRIAGTTPAESSRESRWWKRWFSAPRLAAVGISAVALIAAGSWYLSHRAQPAVADRLLARAYTEKRTLELRIAGASYAPLRVSLGPAASFTSRPPALLKAEAMIASKLASRPSDSAWLQAQAKADVLEGKYDAAVEALRRALELQPHSPAILTDLATAYFQRAQQEDRKEDFGAAYEYLSQALQSQPDDPVALFNRAIVAEHQFLYQQALEDWEHYLRVDSGSPWAEEARNRANAVREKLKEHQSRMTPLLSPAELMAPADTTRDPEVDERIEEYLHEAVRSWLPRAFPENKANADANALQALFFLAELTKRNHGDLWLTDLLRGSSTQNFPQAAGALAEAVTANDTAQFDVAVRKSDLAGRLFRKSGNAAGTLRAEFERSFADQINRRSEECRQRSIAAERQATHYAYPWVQIQFELEEGVCSVLMGDIGVYERTSQRAQDRAQRAGYSSLSLRALGFVAESNFLMGDRSGGWKVTEAGLERYWSGPLPAMRGYTLYYGMAYPAEAAAWPNLQLAIWREAVALIDTNEDILARADVHVGVAKVASRVQQLGLAEHEYEEAARLYALAPQTAATRSDRLESEIRTAQFEVRQDAPDAALGRLSRVQDEVRQLSNNLVAQIFYSTLGEAQLRSQHAAEAEQAFLPAMRLAERNLVSLASEAGRETWSKDAAPVYLGLAEAELVQGREQESLDVFEWYLGASQRASTRGFASKAQSAAVPSLPDPSRLVARLPLLPSQTILAYGVLPDGLAIWVYDNRGVRAKWIPKSPEELQDGATAFYSVCADPKSDLEALRRDGQALYTLLIVPVEEWMDPHRTLVIETSGFLDRIPFEALIDSKGHYLIERAAIVHSPGLYAEDRMHSVADISPDLPSLVVGSGASSPDTGLFSVPNVSAAADAVAARFHSPRVLKGQAATLGAVSMALPTAAVFHFAGHAVSTPSNTGLMLVGRSAQAEDAKSGGPVLLDANAVRSLDLRKLQLAVLAACNSDSGDRGSRGFDSVAKALQDSGVPHVVASRWAVDALESTAFMDSFYGSLLSGQPVSQATRETASKMLQNPQTAHPYHWAAFAAYGRP